MTDGVPLGRREGELDGYSLVAQRLTSKSIWVRSHLPTIPFGYPLR